MGETPDISVFRFKFSEPIYYLDSNARFPQPNMLPGRFLGIARTTGDSFTFYVLTDRHKEQNVILTRSVIRKRNPLDPTQYTDYDYVPTLEEEDENITDSITTKDDTSDAEIIGITNEDQSRGDIELPYEPENVTLTTLLAQQIEKRDPEEIILDGDPKVIDWEVKGTKEIMLHFEDGSYRKMNTEDVYNHMSDEYKCEDIAEIISPKYSEDTGKLYVIVKWRNGQESIIDADLIKGDDPLRLA
jgi:hypothetical protein